MSRRGSSSEEGDGTSNPQYWERGTRRKKIARYLRTANELRQSYQHSYVSAWATGKESVETDYAEGLSGPLPDSGLIRTEDEEIILFPTYAKKHLKRKVGTLTH